MNSIKTDWEGQNYSESPPGVSLEGLPKNTLEHESSNRQRRNKDGFDDLVQSKLVAKFMNFICSF
jgi:hypothetical protein